MRGIACIGSVVRIHLFKNLHRCLSINFSVHFRGTQRHAHFHPLLQMRMGGVQNRGMAPKPHWSGPPRGRTWLSSQTATFLGTSSLLVSEAGRHPGPSALPRGVSCSRSCTIVSAFQRSSWASRCGVMVRTSPSPFAWTGETLASLQKTCCWRALASECPYP